MATHVRRKAALVATAAATVLSLVSVAPATAAPTRSAPASEVPVQSPGASLPTDTQVQAELPQNVAAPRLNAATATGSVADPYAPKITLKTDPNYVALSSKPGASKTLWLVFGGGELTGSKWNQGRHPVDTANEPANYRPFTDPIDFNAVGLDSKKMRTEIFKRMSEQFSPFDVNVTTVRPAQARLTKDSAGDTQYGGVAIFTADRFSSDLEFDDADDANGIAHFDTFGDPTDYYAWITTAWDGDHGNPKVLSGIASHEVGHTLALDHQGNSASPDPAYKEYYKPVGLWAPIMGKSYDAGTARWAKNSYPNHRGGQDDLKVMTDPAGSASSARLFVPSEDNRLVGEDEGVCTLDGESWLADPDPAVDCDVPEVDRVSVAHHSYFSGRLRYSADDHSKSRSKRATWIRAKGGKKTGIISRNGDADTFRVHLTKRGKLILSAKTASYGPSLDLTMTVRNAKGKLIGTFNPKLKLVKKDPYGDGMYPTLTGTGAKGSLKHLKAGWYYVTITGTGVGRLSDLTWNSSAKTAPKYGSLGRYTLTTKFVRSR